MKLHRRHLLSLFQRRSFSTATSNPQKKLAVVGSGPSAFYTILNILKEKPNDYQIDMFEKNPSPFGLVRYGVAPDHPEVKNCIDRFHDIESFIPNGTFKYFGNVSISEPGNPNSLHLKDLYKNYNGVLYAYGSSCANLPELSGIEHPAVIDSYTFVNWYNGHSNFSQLPISNDSFKKIKNVTIIGNGNVAIDIVRVLLAPASKYWSTTDIAPYALELLKQSNIKNVNVVARRGVLESKFTNKELRELLEMDKMGVIFTGWNSEDFKDELAHVKLDRVNKRRVSLLEKFDTKFKNSSSDKPPSKTWNLQYLKSPIGVKVKNDELLDETIFSINQKIFNKDLDKFEIKPAGKIDSVETDLLILATGYKCKPLADFKDLEIPFEKGKLVNENGKVNTKIGKSYCTGWVANGSTGNINSTVMDSMNVSNTIVNDMEGDFEEKKGREGIEEILKKKNIKSVSWDDWNKIHEFEKTQGEKSNKPYEKLPFEKMMELV